MNHAASDICGYRLAPVTTWQRDSCLLSWLHALRPQLQKDGRRLVCRAELSQKKELPCLCAGVKNTHGWYRTSNCTGIILYFLRNCAVQTDFDESCRKQKERPGDGVGLPFFRRRGGYPLLPRRFLCVLSTVPALASLRSP